MTHTWYFVLTVSGNSHDEEIFNYTMAKIVNIEALEVNCIKYAIQDGAILLVVKAPLHKLREVKAYLMNEGLVHDWSDYLLDLTVFQTLVNANP